MKVKNISRNETEIWYDNRVVLLSYGVPVAINVFGEGFWRTSTKYSVTTSKHINRWIGPAVSKEIPQSEINRIAEGA